MAIIMASATAASAAATVMMKMANTWPVRRTPVVGWFRKAEAYATSVMLTALSMISMLMRIETALRLLSAPKRPMQKTTAPSTRKLSSVTMRLLLSAPNHNGADNGDEQDHGGDFKREHVAVGEGAIEQLPDADDRATIRARADHIDGGERVADGHRAGADGVDESAREDNADHSGQQPLRAEGIAVAPHAVLSEHNGEEDEHSDGAGVDEHLN